MLGLQNHLLAKMLIKQKELKEETQILRKKFRFLLIHGEMLMKTERQHKPQHEDSAGLMYSRQSAPLRNMKTSLTMMEIGYFQLRVKHHRTTSTSEVYCRPFLKRIILQPFLLSVSQRHKANSIHLLILRATGSITGSHLLLPKLKKRAVSD